MKPWKSIIRVDAIVQVFHQISKYQPLLPSPMSSYPQPAISKIIVQKEDVTLLEAAKSIYNILLFLLTKISPTQVSQLVRLPQLISIGHPRVG